MKSILLVAVSAALLSACAATGPQTAWGKPGVSKVDYVTDLGTCTAMAAMTQGNNASTVIDQQQGSLPQTPGGATSQAGGGAGDSSSSAGAAAPIGGGGMYRDSTPTDVVNRAANQQQAQEIAAKRARVDALKSCYAERGYKEFKLTPEQSARLATMQQGSNEYLQYLAEIGANPNPQ
jgi:hypothetical protein